MLESITLVMSHAVQQRGRFRRFDRYIAKHSDDVHRMPIPRHFEQLIAAKTRVRRAQHMVIHQVLWVSMDGSLHKLICLCRPRHPSAAFRPLLIHHMSTHRLRVALVRTGTASALLKHICRTGRQAHPSGFERHVRIFALESSMALPLQAKPPYLILPMASIPVPNHFERFKIPYKMKLQDLHREMLASVGRLTVSISQRSSSSLRSSVHRPNPTRRSQDLLLHYPANSLCVKE